ncbi:MAG: Abi family protein [Corynebacterium sp.]|nr:Abi family protein [Corynebacterium sp.]
MEPQLSPHSCNINYVRLLVGRGLSLGDKTPEQAATDLEFAGFYNIFNYTRDMLQSDGRTFLEGITWDDIVSRINADRELRRLYSQYLEMAEARIKTEVASELAGKYGPFGYLDGDNFASWQRHSNFLSNLGREINREHQLFLDPSIVPGDNGDLDSIEAGMESGKIPIWGMVDYVSFGILTRSLYRALEYSDKCAISERFNINSEKIFNGYLQQLAIVRNVCAHHSRLFDRRFVDVCPLEEKHLKVIESCSPGFKIDRHSLFASTLALVSMLPIPVALKFVSTLSEFAAKFDTYGLKNCGFSDNWVPILTGVIRSNTRRAE